MKRLMTVCIDVEGFNQAKLDWLFSQVHTVVSAVVSYSKNADPSRGYAVTSWLGEEKQAGAMTHTSPTGPR